MTKSTTRIVLAHSGGLDTSIAIPWLAERHDAEVVAVTLDLGQDSELTEIREAALAAGAVRAHVIDACGEFVERYALVALQAGALYEGCDPLSAALGRAIVAARLVDVAGMEGATAIAYGPGLDASVRALDPSLTVIVPTTLWELSHADKLAYARARNVQVVTAAEGSAAASANVWGRYAGSFAPGTAAAQDIGYVLTRSAARLSGRAGVSRHRVRSRRPRSGQRNRDDVARDDGEPRDHRWSARRWPDRTVGERRRRYVVARRIRGAGSRRAAHGASSAGAVW